MTTLNTDLVSSLVVAPISAACWHSDGNAVAFGKLVVLPEMGCPDMPCDVLDKADDEDGLEQSCDEEIIAPWVAPERDEVVPDCPGGDTPELPDEESDGDAVDRKMVGPVLADVAGDNAMLGTVAFADKSGQTAMNKSVLSVALPTFLQEGRPAPVEIGRNAGGHLVKVSGTNLSIWPLSEPLGLKRAERQGGGSFPVAEPVEANVPGMMVVGKNADFELGIGLHIAADTNSGPVARSVPAGQFFTCLEPKIGQELARQIGSGMTNHDSDQIEITLKPEELGMVRLTIAGGERPVVTVYADHHETLDLLRRHADVLARELESSGLGGAKLSFGNDSGGGHRHAQQDPRGVPVVTNDQVASQTEEPRQRANNTPEHGLQIDIRI